MVGPDRHHGRCDQRYLLGLLRRRRGHHVELPGGVRGDPGQGPVLLALRRPRQPLLEHARGRRQGGKDFLGSASGSRPLARGKGALGVPQKRLPQELRAGITDMPTASSRRSSCHQRRFATPAEPGTAFVPFTGALDDILCIHEERTVSNDNTVRYKRLALQIPAGRHRRHYVKARVRDDTPTAQWPSSMTAMSGAIPRRWPTDRQPNPRGRVPLRRDRPAPCGQVDSR